MNGQLLQRSLRTMVILFSINFTFSHEVMLANLSSTRNSSHIILRMLRVLVCTILTCYFTNGTIWCLFSSALTFDHLGKILGSLWMVGFCLWELLDSFWPTKVLTDRFVCIYVFETFVVHISVMSKFLFIIIHFKFI